MLQKIKDGFVGQRMLVMPKPVLQKLQHNPLVSDLYFTAIGFFPHAVNHFRKRKNGSQEYVLIYCPTGEGIIKLKGKQLLLRPREYYILPPHVAHEYAASADKPWTIYWLHFTGNKAPMIYQKFGEFFDQGLAKLQVASDPAKKFNYIFELLARGYAAQNVECANLSLWNLLRSFIYPNMGAEELQHNQTPSIVKKAIDFLTDNLSQHLQVADMASHFNYSASHFFNLFKAETGYSPIQYFNYLKAQKACELLVSTSLSIKEISFDLGYKDQLYFSRMFKKIIGVSPQGFRDEQ